MLMKDAESLPASLVTGNGSAMLSNRISHFFDLKGISCTVDTGCSGSMICLHQAVQSLQLGETNMSIVGASSLVLNPDFHVALSSIGVTGADGKCYSWDSRWQGYGRGEGMVVLVLKRLSQALRDGDFVHSVVRESASNQDGRTSTITSPSMESQRALIKQCYRQAGIDMSGTGYVEAHMTGTSGDVIEAEAIAQTIGKSRAAGDPVLVGSVKTNIGHTEPVSGLASVVKTVMALRHQRIPANLNYKHPNPLIPKKEWNVEVPTAWTPWPKDKALRASVNNFGYGGSNVHVILEAFEASSDAQASIIGTLTNDAPDSHSSTVAEESLVFTVSARHSAGVVAMNKQLAKFIRDAEAHHRQISPTDLAHTLTARRSRFQWTTAVRAGSLLELASRLEMSDRTPVRTGPKPPRIGFVFSGQGAQWYGMARELLSSYDVFASAIEQADGILRNEYGASWSLYGKLPAATMQCPTTDRGTDELLADERLSRVHDIALGQPMSVAVQLALVDLLLSWNIKPSAVVSHSSGEIAAAYATGVLSFQEALGVVYHRGRLAQKYQKLKSVAGGMAAVRLSVEEAMEYIDSSPETFAGKIVIACINSPKSLTLSGDLSAIDSLVSTLEEDGIFARRLKVPMAYHSHHMQHMAQDYRECLQTLLPKRDRRPNVPFASPVTGGILDGFEPEHWAQNLTGRVLFSSAVEAMMNVTGDAPEVLLEIGAHDTLSGPVRQTLVGRPIPYIGCLKRNANAVHTIQDLACDLWVRGYPLSLRRVNKLDKLTPKFVSSLPSYAWNHTSRYTAEPRASREHRSKRFPSHELLGFIVPGSNKTTPTWRNHLRTNDIPWLVDHQLESQVVLPGAAYVSMAIEAVRLIHDSASPVAYHLRDVDIVKALVVPGSSTGVEILFALRPCDGKQLDHKDWFQFELHSVGSDDSWNLHCTGYVLADMSHTFSTSSQPQEFLTAQSTVQDVNIGDAFAAMRELGFHYGPAFQNIRACKVAGSRFQASFAISSAVSQHGYALHPTTLDAMFQCCYAGLPKTATTEVMLLPRSLKRLTISRQLDSQAKQEMQCHIDLLESGKRTIGFNGTAFSRDNPSAGYVHMHDFRLQRIEQTTSKDPQPSSRLGLHAYTRWEPNILHSIPDIVRNAWQIHLTEPEIQFEWQIREAAFHFIHAAWSEVRSEDPSSWPWHQQRMYEWMTSIVERGAAQLPFPDSERWTARDEATKQALFKRLAAQNAVGEMTVKLGRQLSGIVRGEVQPLQVMMESDLLHQYYQELPMLKTRSFKHLQSVVGLYAKINPGAKASHTAQPSSRQKPTAIDKRVLNCPHICSYYNALKLTSISQVLEIGAGTGGATTHVLSAFSSQDSANSQSSMLGSYHFTDISPGFFAAAKEKFSAWYPLLDFRRLDIELDPVEQGFPQGEYDLVVAAQVLHATKSLKHTLENVRRLLKPGGKLILLESTRDTLDTQMVFGTLPGWWLSSEPERKMSPNADVAMWNRTLRSSGFSAVEFAIGDCEHQEIQACSVIVATAEGIPSFPELVSIVGDDTTSQEWMESLAREVSQITGCEHPTLLERFADIQHVSERVYILAMDMSGPFLSTIDEPQFYRLRDLMTNSKGFLWLSRGGLASSKNPLWAQTQGLLRTLRREDLHRRFVHLDFDDGVNPSNVADEIHHILHVLRSTFDYAIPAERGIDWEHAVKDGMLHVPRIYPDEKRDAICSVGAKTVLQQQRFTSPNTVLTWEVSRGALGKRPQFASKPVTTESAMSPGMVEISPEAFGLNCTDLLTAAGMTKQSGISGHEASGIVTRTGMDTTLHPGDRVCGLFQGHFSNKPQAKSTSVAKIPNGMSSEQAASIPYSYSTARIALQYMCRLQAGENILIHSASGDVGQAAVVLAQHVGANVFITCATEEKRQLMMATYGIPSAHVFSNADDSFAKEIMSATSGHGVDVVLNSLEGRLLQATWEIMAPIGRFVHTGPMFDIEAQRLLPMAPFGRGATFASLDPFQWAATRGGSFQQALVEGIEVCKGRANIAMEPIRTFGVGELSQAVQHRVTHAYMGKNVLVPKVNDQVDVLLPVEGVELQRGATYMIVGGVGGVGSAIAAWMAERGAGRLLIVSRNAETHPERAALAKKAEANRCEVLFRNCDVAEEVGLSRLLRQLSADGVPPIRGVVNGAMVLAVSAESRHMSSQMVLTYVLHQSSLLERMSFTQWASAVRPKIRTTLNLHRSLPSLDFFILLSSVTGAVGSASQANYTAANTFQDAFARWRRAQGLPAVTIDLGLITDIRWGAEEEALRGRLEKAIKATAMSSDSTMKLVEEAIRSSGRGGDEISDASQIICYGLQHTEFAEDEGIRSDRRWSPLLAAIAIEQRTTRETQETGHPQPEAMSRMDHLMGEVHLLAKAPSNHGAADEAVKQKAVDLVTGLLVAKAAGDFNLSVADIDPAVPLIDHGVDSLVAVQFRNWLSAALKVQVGIFDILQNRSLREFAGSVVDRSSLFAHLRGGLKA